MLRVQIDFRITSNTPRFCKRLFTPATQSASNNAFPPSLVTLHYFGLRWAIFGLLLAYFQFSKRLDRSMAHFWAIFGLLLAYLCFDS